MNKISDDVLDPRVAQLIKLDEVEMRKVYCDEFLAMVEQGLPIMHLDADCMTGIGILPYRPQYPNNIIECGVSEANMVSVAAGMSREGLIPFTHSLASFASRRPYDQIYISGAYAKSNIRILSTDSGVTAGYNGGTHAPVEDIALMRAMPGMIVLEPTDSVMLRDLLKTVVQQYGMFYIRLTRRKLPIVYRSGSTFPIGGSVTVRLGNDVTVFTSGFLVAEMLRIAQLLESESISLRVVDLYSIKPMDEQTVIAAAKDTGVVVTVENHNTYGGLGSAVAEILSQHFPVPVIRVGIPDQFLFSAAPAWLMDNYGLSDAEILAAVRLAFIKKQEYKK